MPILPLLKDPHNYQPDSWLLDAAHHIQWYVESVTNVVEAQIAEHLRQHGPQYQNKIKILRAELQEFLADTQALSAHAPTSTYQSDLQVLELLRAHGLNDPYRQLKLHENQTAAALYPARVAELDQLSGQPLALQLIQGTLAGNRFDMGCTAGINDYQKQGAHFHQAISALPPRPWHIDEFDAFLPFFNSLANQPRKILFFVDNAGADFVLGCLPFIRALAQQGCTVVVACNGIPALNDITLSEAQQLADQLAQNDPTLANFLNQNRITFIESGGRSLLIDFSTVSFACAKHATDTDFLIIEGMGRSVESNFHANFTCPTLRVCLLKDQFLAARVNAQLFDAICRFTP